MRILLHDYGRYPFIVELAGSLVNRGHQVLFAYSAADTARSDVEDYAHMRSGFKPAPIKTSRPLDKSSLLARWAYEREHGSLLADQVDSFRPDIVVSANTPLDAQAQLSARCKTRSVPLVYWAQDLLGLAIDRIVRKKLGPAGAVIGARYLRLERALLRKSSRVIAITEDFRSILEDWGVHPSRLHVIDNWAPLNQCVPASRRNPWSTEHGLDDAFVFLYSGTMGMKHNPEILVRLARSMASAPEVRIVVVSEGAASDWLRKQKEQGDLDNLVLLPFQPQKRLPQVLASADVLVAVLEPSAGVFSVPSKVLTYMCAGRPVLLAVPPENQAARIIAENKAGMVAPPTDIDAFVRSAQLLHQDGELRARMGANARCFAESHFDIDTITDKFEAILRAV